MIIPSAYKNAYVKANDINSDKKASEADAKKNAYDSQTADNLKSASEQAKTDGQQKSDTVSLSQDYEKFLEAQTKAKEQLAEKFGLVEAEATSSTTPNINTSEPQDETALLAKQLAAAKSSMEVHRILAKAMENAAKIRLSMGSADSEEYQKIQALVKKYDKIARAATKKNNSITEVEALRIQEKRAVEKEKAQAVKEIKAEIKKIEEEQRKRDKKLLKEMNESSDQDDKMQFEGPASTRVQQGQMTDAQIQAMAEAMVDVAFAAEASMPSADVGASVPTGGTASADIPAADVAVDAAAVSVE